MQQLICISIPIDESKHKKFPIIGQNDLIVIIEETLNYTSED